MADEQKSPESLTRTEFYSALANILFIVFGVFIAATLKETGWFTQAYRVLVIVTVLSVAVYYQRRAKIGIFGKMSQRAWTLVFLWWLVLAGVLATVIINL